MPNVGIQGQFETKNGSTETTASTLEADILLRLSDVELWARTGHFSVG